MVCVWIDELTPCLKSTKTGELVKTEVVRIKRKSFLKKYNKKTGWAINWEKQLNSNEVYALVLEGTVDIQGLISLSVDKDSKAVYIDWMCTNPLNNKLLTETPAYYGIGGHLFAIASQRSMEEGFDGVMTGYAANQELLEHYCSVFHAEFLGILHPYQFIIDDVESAKIREVYDYAWTDEII